MAEIYICPSMRKNSHLSHIVSSLKPSLRELRSNDPLRMAGATAFFTTFALPPILFIFIQLFGFFIDRRMIGTELIKRLTNILGKAGAAQVRQVLRSIRGFSDNWYIIILGVLFLIFVATTLFSVIKNSLNQIWKIRAKESPGIFFFMNIRARSLAIILLAGLLFLGDILTESMEIALGNYIDALWPGGGAYFKTAMNEIVGAFIVSIWFIVLFRYLADGRPRWKIAIIGGIITGILFTLGKLLLRFLIIHSNVNLLYGTSGSIVLILLFVFYSSFILYYGACFVELLSEKMEQPIHPLDKAYRYRLQEVKEKEL